MARRPDKQTAAFRAARRRARQGPRRIDYRSAQEEVGIPTICAVCHNTVSRRQTSSGFSVRSDVTRRLAARHGFTGTGAIITAYWEWSCPCGRTHGPQVGLSDDGYWFTIDGRWPIAARPAAFDEPGTPDADEVDRA